MAQEPFDIENGATDSIVHVQYRGCKFPRPGNLGLKLGDSSALGICHEEAKAAQAEVRTWSYPMRKRDRRH